MNTRKTLLAMALAASSLGISFATHAERFSNDVETAPPAPRYEQFPAREGYIVTPGYYRYDTERREHTWVKGDYQAERRGEHFIAPEWREQNGRYRFNEGRWEKDNKGQ
jgi:hypothetical protein